MYFKISFLNKMKDLFTTIVEGPLGMFAEFMGSILTSTEALIPLLSVAVGFLAAMAVKGAMVAISSISTAIAKLFSGNAPFGPVGIAAAIEGTATMVGLISSSSKIPNAEFGGKVKKGGVVRVGEGGKKEVLEYNGNSFGIDAYAPEGAKITPLNVAERGDLRATATQVAPLDLKPMLDELKSLREGFNRLPLAISNIKMVTDTQRFEIGRMVAGSQLQ